LELKKGQNEITIKNLPTVVDGDSIRADGPGNAIIFDVVYSKVLSSRHWAISSLSTESPFPRDWKLRKSGERRKKESAEIESLLKQQAALKRECTVVDKQLAILETYAQTLSSEYAKSDALTEFLTTYGKYQLEFMTKKQELDDQLEILDDSIKAAREAEGRAVSDNKRGTRIVVIVLAEEDGPTELNLTYNVTGAFWTPVYDLRAEIAGSGANQASVISKKVESASESFKIHLSYRASISQRTAEDWTNVHLTLSTASPQLGSTIPKLSSIRLGKGWTDFSKAPLRTIAESPNEFRRSRSYSESGSALEEVEDVIPCRDDSK
jgi:uncharacterized protein (TIGR02231 family)